MTIYKRSGDYIEWLDNRNTDLSVDRLVGLTIDKQCIHSVADAIRTDLSEYKVIRKNQFAYSLMQVSRDRQRHTDEVACVSSLTKDCSSLHKMAISQSIN